NGIAASDPHGKHGLWPDDAAAMRLRAGGDRSCGGVRRRERGRNVHDQDGVVLPGLQQRFECGEGARRIGVAGEVDGGGARPGRGGGRGGAFLLPPGRAGGGPPRRPGSRSTASTPTPPPLVNIASRLPGNGRTRPSVSAAANNSSRSSTRNRPAR